MRKFVRLSLFGLVALVALGFGLNQSQTSAKQVEVIYGSCSADGVTLTVDFGTSNTNQIITKCIKNFTGNSWNLLKAAGLKITGTEKYPTGFLCRINGYPDQQHEACKETPGVTYGSWAYYLADSGKWEYSAFGASSHRARCGTSEGWRFLAPKEPLTSFPRTTPTKYSCEK